MAHTKYDKTTLLRARQKAKSVSDILRLLGISVSGGNHRHITQRLKFYGIDVPKYKSTKPIPRIRKKWTEVLVENKRVVASRLRTALLESGRKEICEVCSLEPQWQKHSLRLQIDHKNGIHNDNRPDNIRFLCPNCHSQTHNYAGNGSKRNKLKVCCSCGKQISKQSVWCRGCFATNRLGKNCKIVWPKYKILIRMIAKTNMNVVSKKLGISWTALQKHLKSNKHSSSKV